MARMLHKRLFNLLFICLNTKKTVKVSRGQDDQKKKPLNFCKIQVSWKHPNSGLQQQKVPQEDLEKPSLTKPNILDNSQSTGLLWTVFVAERMAPFFYVIDGFEEFTQLKFMFHIPNSVHLQACNPSLQMMWRWLFQKLEALQPHKARGSICGCWVVQNWSPEHLTASFE